MSCSKLFRIARLYHFLKLSSHNTCIHQRVHLFEDIQPHTLHAIVSKLQNLLTVPCEVLIEQGVPGSPMYFIALGIVEVKRDLYPHPFIIFYRGVLPSDKLGCAGAHRGHWSTPRIQHHFAFTKDACRRTFWRIVHD
jgi:hypothetical protein